MQNKYKCTSWKIDNLFKLLEAKVSYTAFIPLSSIPHSTLNNAGCGTQEKVLDLIFVFFTRRKYKEKQTVL